MKIDTKQTCFILLIAIFPTVALAQSADSIRLKHWHQLSYEADGVYGTGMRALKSGLKAAPNKKMVVAIIDSGFDLEHSDLEGAWWTNPGEIAGNGVDDDQNGYVDDVHGWNFLVDDAGNDFEMENLECTRVLRAMSADNAAELYPWLTTDLQDKAVNVFNESVAEFQEMDPLAGYFVAMDSVAQATLGKSDYTLSEVANMTTTTEQAANIASVAASLNEAQLTVADLREIHKEVRTSALYHLNVKFQTRQNPAPQTAPYGNHNLEGNHADHGTHVAGIVAANSQNGIGAEGLAHGEAVIMALRAVPNGDEHDGDVAAAIRYAVNNGANIINMSFGKGLSPYKSVVDDALRFAAENNVLVVHGAGNEGQNLEESDNFPTAVLSDGNRLVNYLEVGASSASTGKDLTASFSNYGKLSVHLFAPGVDIYSCVPQSQYKKFSGTSMASPVVAGVAAVVWAYHPTLSAEQVANVLCQSVKALPKKKVLLPGGEKGKEKIKFKELSQFAGIVNAEAAFSAASALVMQP